MQRLYKYQRSVELSNTLSNAGIGDNHESNIMIARKLLDAAKEVTDKRQRL